MRQQLTWERCFILLFVDHMNIVEDRKKKFDDLYYWKIYKWLSFIALKSRSSCKIHAKNNAQKMCDVKTLNSIDRFIQLNLDCNIYEDCTFNKHLQWSFFKIKDRHWNLRKIDNQLFVQLFYARHRSSSFFNYKEGEISRKISIHSIMIR